MASCPSPEKNWSTRRASLNAGSFNPDTGEVSLPAKLRPTCPRNTKPATPPRHAVLPRAPLQCLPRRPVPLRTRGSVGQPFPLAYEDAPQRTESCCLRSHSSVWCLSGRTHSNQNSGCADSIFQRPGPITTAVCALNVSRLIVAGATRNASPECSLPLPARRFTALRVNQTPTEAVPSIQLKECALPRDSAEQDPFQTPEAPP